MATVALEKENMKNKILLLLILSRFLVAINPFNPKFSWMDKQIREDFAPFSSGILQEHIDDLEGKWHKFHRYKIVGNVVYGKDCKILSLLQCIARRWGLPDCDFIYLNEDGVVQPKGMSRNPPVLAGPFFTSTKHKHFQNTIFFADWNFDPKRSDLVKSNRYYDWPLVAKIVDTHSRRISWKNKKPVAVWRGGLQGYQYDYSPKGIASTPRGRVSLLSLKYPDLINAGTSWGPEENKAVNNLYSKGIKIHKHFLDHKSQLEYKYLIDIDGHTCTYPGFQWKLLSNSLVLKQETQNKMWFYSVLKPWEHYVPVKEDLSDLIEKITWCRENDEAAQQIAAKGRRVALENLLPEHCMVYCYKVLVHYASLQKFRVSR